MSTVTVVLRLKEDDPESEGVSRVLTALTRVGGQRVLSGGGGYLDGRPSGDNLVVLVMQKNKQDTGSLVDVTEEDREHVSTALLEHPEVACFVVGPIERGGRAPIEVGEDEELLVAQFRRLFDAPEALKP